MRVWIPGSEWRKLRREIIARATGYVGMQIKRNIRNTFYGGASNFARGVKVYPHNGVVFINRKYATTHEYGAVIEGKRSPKKMLKFKPRGAGRGQYVFRRRVKIPARPYVQPALDKLATTGANIG